MRAFRRIFAVLVLAGALAVPARAGEPVTFSAPFTCGSDVLAQQAGLLVSPMNRPPAASCVPPVNDGAAVWTSLAPGKASMVTVHANWTGYGVLCVFAIQGKERATACGLDDATIFVQGSAPVTIGAYALDPKNSVAVSVVHSLVVQTF